MKDTQPLLTSRRSSGEAALRPPGSGGRPSSFAVKGCRNINANRTADYVTTTNKTVYSANATKDHAASTTTKKASLKEMSNLLRPFSSLFSAR